MLRDLMGQMCDKVSLFTREWIEIARNLNQTGMTMSLPLYEGAD